MRTASHARWALLVFVSSVLLSGGCVVLPSGKVGNPKYDDAVGSITVSTPLFTPIETAVRDGKRLAFGDLRNEHKLATAIQQAQVGITNVEYRALETALAAKFEGSKLDLTQTTRTTSQSPGSADDQTSREESRTKTFRSPEVKEAPTTPETPKDIESALVAVLQRSAASYKLPPDELASLIAAYKTYMVNLEEYFNVDGFGLEQGHVTDYVPYKMHLTVSAEPAWFTRYHDHEAVVELELLAQGRERPVIEQRVRPCKCDGKGKGKGKCKRTRKRDCRCESKRQCGCERTPDCKSSCPVCRTHAACAAGQGALWQPSEGSRPPQPATPSCAPRVSPPSPHDVLVLTASPIETAQTIEQMTAALVRVANATNLAGSFQQAAVDASVKFVRERAKRLQGLRSNKTMTVSYPGPNKLRIRFRPSIVPSDDQLDLQPTSRVLTAIVLVRREWCEPVGGDANALFSLTVLDSEKSAKREAISKKIESLVPNHDNSGDGSGGGRSTDVLSFQDEAVQERKLRNAIARLEGLVPSSSIEAFSAPGQTVPEMTINVLQEVADQANRHLPRPLQGRYCVAKSRAYFAPSMVESDGSQSPPRSWLLWRSREYKRRNLRAGARLAWIPPWFGEARKRLSLTDGNGYYWADLRQARTAALALQTAASNVTKAKTAVTEKTAAEAAAKKAHEKKPTAATCEALKKATEALKKAKSTLQKAEVAQADAKGTANRELSLALLKGRVSLAFEVSAPTIRLATSNGIYETSKANVFTRVGTLDGDDRRDRLPGDHWRSIGPGDRRATIELDNVDLSHAITIDAKGNLTSAKLTIFLDAALLTEKEGGPGGPFESIPGWAPRAVLEIDVHPRSAKAAAASTAKKASDPTGAKLTLGLGEVDLKFAAPKTTTTTTPSSTTTK